MVQRAFVPQLLHRRRPPIQLNSTLKSISSKKRTTLILWQKMMSSKKNWSFRFKDPHPQNADKDSNINLPTFYLCQKVWFRKLSWPWSNDCLIKHFSWYENLITWGWRLDICVTTRYGLNWINYMLSKRVITLN